MLKGRKGKVFKVQFLNRYTGIKLVLNAYDYMLNTF